MNNNIDQEKLEQLAHKFKLGTLTDAEREIFEAWYANHNDEEIMLPEEKNIINKRIHSKIVDNIQYKKSGSLLRLSRTGAFQIAACLLLVISVVFYFQKRKSIVAEEIAINQTDVAPGTNIATLTIRNGQKISLNDAKNGLLLKESGISIRKTKDGQLQYVITETSSEASNEIHTIETPNGGQYSIILPDGTAVSLNAASSLTYPSSFANANQRRVELTGEAYFEVAKNANKPFIVKTRNEVVEVLGTHFNINSYANEPESKTTLLEGSVKVRKNNEQEAKLLKPGQQSIIGSHQFVVKAVDVETETAWKNGEFIFTGQNLQTIMRTISRWYNVDIKYTNKQIDQLQIEGQVSRTRNLSVVLKSLEDLTGINFELKGKEVTISN